MERAAAEVGGWALEWLEQKLNSCSPKQKGNSLTELGWKVAGSDLPG